MRTRIKARLAALVAVLFLNPAVPCRLLAGIHELHPSSPSPGASPEEQPASSTEGQSQPAPRHRRTRSTGDSEETGGGPPPPDTEPQRGAFTQEAESALKAGDADRALDLADKAMRSGEDRAWAQFARSKALFIKGDRNGAVAAITEAIERRSSVADFRVHRASIYKAMGLQREATRDLGVALSLGLSPASGAREAGRPTLSGSAGGAGHDGDEEEEGTATATSGVAASTQGGAGAETGGGSSAGSSDQGQPAAGGGGADDAAAGLARIRQRLLAAQATIDQMNASAGRINRNLSSIHSQLGGEAGPAGDSGSASSGHASSGPSAGFDSVEQDHQVDTSAGQGVRIRCPLTASGLAGQRCRVVAYFEQPDGTPLRATPGSRFRAADGRVAAAFEFTPTGDSARFAGASLVVPYSALPVPSGVHRVSFYLQAQAADGHVLATSSRQFFELNP